MTKFQTFKIVALSVIITWLLNVFVGRYFVAKISTWPLLNRLQILSPQAPIVINNHETVRVSDSGDILQAATTVKSKISLLVLATDGSFSVAGGAINLTSDGTFISSAASFSKSNGDYYVVLNDGRSAKVTTQVLDPATSLMFFKASISSVPVANLAASKDVSVGDKILFVLNSLQNYTNKAQVTNVSAAQSYLDDGIMFSDTPRASFKTEPPTDLLPGEDIANSNGDTIGIWNGSNIISSDLLQQTMNLYFGNSQTISRPSFGFSYSIITQNQSKLTGQSQGALLKEILAPPAKLAGLISGDIITAVDGKNVSETSPLEEILQKYKVGDVMTLSLSRANKNLDLKLTVGELK